MTLSLSSEPQARSLTDRENTQDERMQAKPLWAKRMSSAYIRVKEVRGQVPGITCNGARINSAINNTGVELHKRRPGVAQCLGTEPKPRGSRSPEVP